MQGSIFIKSSFWINIFGNHHIYLKTQLLSHNKWMRYASLMSELILFGIFIIKVDSTAVTMHKKSTSATSPLQFDSSPNQKKNHTITIAPKSQEQKCSKMGHKNGNRSECYHPTAPISDLQSKCSHSTITIIRKLLLLTWPQKWMSWISRKPVNCCIVWHMESPPEYWLVIITK